MCCPDPPDTPTADDQIQNAIPLLAMQMMLSGGQGFGPGGSIQRGAYDAEGNFSAFDPSNPAVGQLMQAAQGGDMGALAQLFAMQNSTQMQFDPQTQAVVDAGRQTQMGQNMLGQALLGNLLGLNPEGSGFENANLPSFVNPFQAGGMVAPPMGLTPWENTPLPMQHDEMGYRQHYAGSQYSPYGYNVDLEDIQPRESYSMRSSSSGSSSSGEKKAESMRTSSRRKRPTRGKG